jgi:hypothetical protein
MTPQFKWPSKSLVLVLKGIHCISMVVFRVQGVYKGVKKEFLSLGDILEHASGDGHATLDFDATTNGFGIAC